MISLGIEKVSYVVATLIPAGKAVTRSAKRTPRGESWDDCEIKFTLTTSNSPPDKGQANPCHWQIE